MSPALCRHSREWLIVSMPFTLLMPPVLLAQEASKLSGCTEISPGKSVALGRYVKAKYRLPFVPRVEVEDTEPDCYYKLRFISSDAGVHFNRVLYLSPDQTRLIPTAFDIRVDPEQAEMRENETRNRQILAGAKLVMGGKESGVAVIIYSDFQCPHCARLWGMLQKELVPFLDGQATLFHRSFPIESVHPWARSASVLTNCAHTQHREFFLGLADLFYTEQAKLTVSSLSEVSHSYLQRQPGFDETAFSSCVSSGLGDRDLAADIESARRMEIKGAPTMFINGFRIDGVPSPQQLRTVLREAVAAGADSRQIPSSH
jgi:protein-disulfide isomerase